MENNMENNKQDKWALFINYVPSNVISHGEFIFSKDHALSIYNNIKKQDEDNRVDYTMWIQKKNSDEKLYLYNRRWNPSIKY